MVVEVVPSKLLIRPWPKMIFLWPTAVMALFMALANQFLPENWKYVWGGTFLFVMGLNFFVLTFDFPRATSLTMAMAILAVVFLLLLLNHYFDVIRPIKDVITSRQIWASTEFYWAFFVILMILFFGMFLDTRFDYWELTANEIIHHHGILGDTERFSTAGLKLNKEISDIFEYVLCGAGRMIMLIPSVQRPVVLDNVLNIARIERISDQILDARVVRFDTGKGGDVPVHVKEADE